MVCYMYVHVLLKIKGVEEEVQWYGKEINKTDDLAFLSVLLPLVFNYKKLVEAVSKHLDLKPRVS